MHVGREMTGLTQGRLVTDSIAQEVPGAHGGQLRETFHEPLGLCSFTNARRTDENDASGAFELPGGHPKAVCTLGMRSGAQGGGNLELRSPTRWSRGSSRLREYIYYGLILRLLRGFCTYVQGKV